MSRKSMNAEKDVPDVLLKETERINFDEMMILIQLHSHRAHMRRFPTGWKNFG